MIKICNFIAKWMGLLVLLVAALSLLAPTTFSWISTWYINPMLGVIMFGMGLTLSPKDFKIVLSRPKDILVGCFFQFLIMPMLAWGLTWAFSLPKELALGVILVCRCYGSINNSGTTTYPAAGTHNSRNYGKCRRHRNVTEHCLCGHSTYRLRTDFSEVSA